ncbi:MAG: hypothetical protein RL368_276 [Pseudomonadota bacterium]|jgi:hypothetical protein
MSLFRKVIVSAVLLAAQNTYAADYSLDASTMAVGATTGENLIVKEGCLDPAQTTCAATEKVKWLTTPLTKVGSLEILGALQGDFEINITADFDNGQKGVVLTNAENKGFQFNVAVLDIGPWNVNNRAAMVLAGLGSGGGDGQSSGWNGGYSFNRMTITVKNGTAKAYLNGAENGKAIVFDPTTTFNRVVIQGIVPTDRISEVKVRGLQSATSCPSTTTPATSTTNNSGTCTASYSSTTGALIIPCIAVPVTSVFGGATQTLNYSVQLQQRTGSFAFDLDLNKVQQK